MQRRVVWCLALAALAAATSASDASPALQVVGGTPIQVQSAPWVVLVGVVFNHAIEQDCTGSVIDATHVVTAAHCLYDSAGRPADPSTVYVVAGVSNFLTPSPTDREQDPAVSSFRIHPGYVSTKSDAPDDVAVLTLAAALDLSGPAVQPIALPATDAPFPEGTAVAIAGFGLQAPTADDTDGALVSMTATIDSQASCGEVLDSTIEFDNGIVFCASSPTSSVCHGDSGGPVFTTGGTPVLIGIVNASPRGCSIGDHGLHAYVGAPEILSFIQGNDRPPTAPRPTALTQHGLTWGQPLVPGDTLTCSTRGWPEPVQIVYAFLDAATEQLLQTGRQATYMLPPEAAGTRILCRISATGSGGMTMLYTTSTPTIKQPPNVTIEPLAPLAARRGRQVTLRVVLRSPPGLSGGFSVCATPPASVGEQVCRSTRQPFGASGRFPFALTLQIKPTAAVGTVRIAVSATAGTSSAQTTALLRITKA